MLRTTSAWDGDNPSLPDLSPAAAGQHPWHGGWILSVSIGKGPCGSVGLCPGSHASLRDSNLNFGQNQAPVPLGMISLAAAATCGASSPSPCWQSQMPGTILCWWSLVSSHKQQDCMFWDAALSCQPLSERDHVPLLSWGVPGCFQGWSTSPCSPLLFSGNAFGGPAAWV